MSKTGTFVISLDFELYFGMFDKVSLSQYGENIAGVHTAIPRLLSLFEERGIHATWATVGMLMHENKEELQAHLPHTALVPRYDDMRLSAYEHLKIAKMDGINRKYYFGKHLIEQILKTPHQELASHTFSHYYTVDGVKNNEATFTADCDAFKKASAWTNVPVTSIVFPRNQINTEVLKVCAAAGFKSYRGTPRHFLYTGKAETSQTNPLLRALRLVDTYINLTGHHTHKIGVKPLFETRSTDSLMAVNRHSEFSDNITGLVNIPGSWFLRPYSHRLRLLESLKIRRIKNAMTHAAKNGELYHLWWHPHNFGINQEQNFKNLETILNHFVNLKKEYAMESMNMKELTNKTKGTPM
ncbi:MAG: hypothetical protein RLZZ76_241 [Candidatus Parcubacteria bacterium]|jgi:peptidoglycan/xylan/chitin deacetylase (PgdA/CDA1 family)